MSRASAFEGFRWLALVTAGIALAATPAANAATEVPPQCFILKPYNFTVRLVRFASEYTPGIQALTGVFQGPGFQMLGMGVRTKSLTPLQKDILVSFVDQGGGEYRLTALYDAANATGPWWIVDNSSGDQILTGTLLKFGCEQDLRGLTDAEGPAAGGAGLNR